MAAIRMDPFPVAATAPAGSLRFAEPLLQWTGPSIESLQLLADQYFQFMPPGLWSLAEDSFAFCCRLHLQIAHANASIFSATYSFLDSADDQLTAGSCKARG